MEQFANPETMHSLSIGDKLVGSGITALMGMGITFAVLILLWGFIALMAKVNTNIEKGDKASTATAAATPSGAETKKVANDDTLIAVIAAAIAASEGGSANLIVKRISRISGQSTPWETAGRADCAESRKF